MKNILPITLFFFLLSCLSSKKNTSMSKEAVKSPSGDFEFFDKQGHRGCRGLMPENTIPAMINALGMAITTLEMDVVITKDKKVILIKNSLFFVYSNISLKIWNHTRKSFHAAYVIQLT